MEIKVDRVAKRPSYTIGRLYIDGAYFCDTIEDAVRDTKIPHITAIPAGRYQVTMAVRSPRFQHRAQYQFCGGRLPRLMNVPNYEGVLIHIGNTEKDTDGCILVGENKVVGKVINSTATFTRLWNALNSAYLRGERIFITLR